MPSYHVEFANGAGIRSETALDAPSLPALVDRLRRNGCTLVRVRAPEPDPSLRGYARRVSEVEVTAFLRQLAVMLDNGVSVAVALGLLARETPNPTLRAILLELERSVRDGNTLSSGLDRYPRLFEPIYVRLLEAGEKGQRVPDVLRQIADYAERAGAAAQRIRTALVYPQVVGVFTTLLLLGTFLFVVPKFLDLFKELGVKEYPLPTQAIFWFQGTVIPALAVVAPPLFLLFWLLYRRSDRQLPMFLVRLRLRVPIIGAMYHQFALLRLTRLLAALLSGGVPLLEALRLAGQGSGSLLLQAAMWDAIPHVAAGESLATAFSHAGILPPTFCGQVAAAETTGDLPEALRRLADWYGERLDYLSARVGALLEPLLILLLAGLTGWVILGVFAPLVGVMQSLAGGG